MNIKDMWNIYIEWISWSWKTNLWISIIKELHKKFSNINFIILTKDSTIIQEDRVSVEYLNINTFKKFLDNIKDIDKNTVVFLDDYEILRKFWLSKDKNFDDKIERLISSSIYFIISNQSSSESYINSEYMKKFKYHFICSKFWGKFKVVLKK